MTWKTRSLLAIPGGGLRAAAAHVCQLEARLTFQRELRPTVAILTDTSASMGLQDAGNQTRLAAARDFASGPLKALAEKADIVRYSFGWKLDADANGAEAARPTRLIDAIADAARRENDLRAMIVLTDGNDTASNRGELFAPGLAARRLPVFPVVFGSAAPKLARVKITSAANYVRPGDELRLAGARSRGRSDADHRAAKRRQGPGPRARDRHHVALGNDAAAT